MQGGAARTHPLAELLLNVILLQDVLIDLFFARHPSLRPSALPVNTIFDDVLPSRRTKHFCDPLVGSANTRHGQTQSAGLGLAACQEAAALNSESGDFKYSGALLAVSGSASRAGDVKTRGEKEREPAPSASDPLGAVVESRTTARAATCEFVFLASTGVLVAPDARPHRGPAPAVRHLRWSPGLKSHASPCLVEPIRPARSHAVSRAREFHRVLHSGCADANLSAQECRPRASRTKLH